MAFFRIRVQSGSLESEQETAKSLRGLDPGIELFRFHHEGGELP